MTDHFSSAAEAPGRLAAERPPSPPVRHDQGFVVLLPRDVVKLLLPMFWTGLGVSEVTALRYCALVALMAFCYVSPWIARKILLSDWRPDGLDVVRVRRFGETQLIPLCDDVIAIVERYIAMRKRPSNCKCGPEPRCGCGPLFTTRKGKPWDSISAEKSLIKAGKEMGATTTLTAMLMAFCERSLKKANDPVAARRFMGYRTVRGPLHRPLPPVPFQDLVRTARRASRWCRPFQRVLNSERLAAEHLLKPSAIPARPKSPAVATKAVPYLAAADHPLVAEILSVEVPLDEKLRDHLKRWRRETYLDKLVELVDDGVMGVPQAAELLLMNNSSGYHLARKYHLSGGRARAAAKRQSRPPQPARPKVRLKPRLRPSHAQASLLARLSSYPWSADEEIRRSQCQEVVSKDFSDVDAMIQDGRVSGRRGRALLGISYVDMLILRAAVAAGFPAGKVIGRGPSPIPTEWARRIETELAGRPSGETDIAFFVRMCSLGYEGQPRALFNLCRRLRTAVPPEAGQAALLKTLRDFAWSEIPEEAGVQQRQLLEDHHAAADALIQGRKANVAELADLFRFQHKPFADLLSALRSGLTPDQALRPKRRLSLTPADWLPARQALEAAPRGWSLRRIYHAAVLAGFPGSEQQFRCGTVRLRTETATKLIEG